MTQQLPGETPVASSWCLYCCLWAYFTPCSSVFIANFEHVITGWEVAASRKHICQIYYFILLRFNVKLYVPTIYLFKVKNGNIRTVCEICSKLTIKAPVINVILVSLFLTLNRFLVLFWWLHYCFEQKNDGNALLSRYFSS